MNEKEITVSRLEDRKQEELERKEEITEYKAYTKTKKFIEDIARDIWGLVYEDEIIFEAEE
jgi:cell division protein DivIC